MMYILLVLLNITTSLFNAASLLPVYLAEQFIQNCKHYRQAEKKDFSLLPDLKDAYIVQRKHSTHPTTITLEHIKACTDALQTSKHLHCCLDETPRHLIKAWNIYASMHSFSHGYNPTLLKFIEDEIIFDYAETKTIQQLVTTSAQSLTLPSGVLEKWYMNLSQYFSKRPIALSHQLCSIEQKVYQSASFCNKKWALHLPSLARQEIMASYIEKINDSSKGFLARRNNDY